MSPSDQIAEAIEAFLEHDGILRFQEALDSGVSRHTLRTMLAEEVVERLTRGVYRLTDLPPLERPDLVAVATRVPEAVVCLVSALSFHDITTQIPHEVSLALNHWMQRHPPAIEHPPIRVFWFGKEAYEAGIEPHTFSGVHVQVYSPEKTIADCFKFRNKIGLDVALEGLRLHHEQNGVHVDELMRFARICRVQQVIRPYLEAIL